MLPRLLLVLIPLLLLPAAAGFALSFVIPWFEDGYGRGLTFHVPAVAITAFLLFRETLEHTRVRARDMHGIQVTAVTTEVEPLPTGTGETDLLWYETGFPGHTVTLEFTDLDGQRQHKRETSGLGGYVLTPGTQVVGYLTPKDPENLEVVEIVGPLGPYPITAPAHRSTRKVLAALLALAVFLTAAVVLGPLYGLPAWATGFLLSASLWMGTHSLWEAMHMRRNLKGLHGRTTGEVTQVYEHPRAGGRRMSYSFTVRFATPDGRQVHRHHTGEDTKPRALGEQVEVRYDQDHPHRFHIAEVNGDRNTMRLSFFQAGLGLVLGTALVIVYWVS